jgi:hypothetical protein
MNSRRIQRTHCPTGAAEAKDKGQSGKSLDPGPSSIVRSLKSAVVLCALAGLTVFAGCDLLNLLLRTDTIPPTCQITSPADSTSVNGMVQIAATASDSVGVERVEFYADGSLIGTDSSAPYSAGWDASGQTQGSWHSFNCIAYDAAENKGYSDTIAAVIAGIGQRSVFHGELDVQAHGAESVWFNAAVGDTLSGDAQVVSGGTLTSLLWLDSDNYQKYVAGQSYTALFRQDNFSQTSMRQEVASSGRFYLVFANSGGATVKCWARFVLE